MLWGGTIRQPRLNQRVLQVGKSDERVNHFLQKKMKNIVGRNLFIYLFMKGNFLEQFYQDYDFENI